MPGNRDRLPDGWELPIPDALWPDVMVSAIRYDLEALKCARVIETLKRWREQAYSADPKVKQLALTRIKNVSKALVQYDTTRDEPTLSIIFEPTQASYTPPLAHDLFDTDSQVEHFEGEEATEAREKTEATVATYKHPQLDPVPPPPPGPPPPPDASQEVRPPAVPDRPVLKPATGPVRKSMPPPPPPPDPPVLTDTPTGGIDALSAIAEMLGEEDDAARTHMALAPGVDWQPPERLPSQTSEPTHFDYQRIVSPEFREEDERPTTASALPPTGPVRKTPSKASSAPKTKSPPSGSVPPPPKLPSEAIQPLAPKPGVIRRRSNVSAKEKRPRASMQQVRTLYHRINALCHELVPLSHPRRARRFWAHWREVSGDQGVSADVVDRVLGEARDHLTLSSELIAEVHRVDVRSVRALIERIIEESHPGDAPITPTEKPRSLVGASVQVEGISDEDARIKGD